MDSIDYTWQDIEDVVNTIAERIQMRKVSSPCEEKFETIIGLSRGGLIPGVMLSQKLGVPFVPIVWQTRDGNVQWTNMLQAYDKQTTLVVDDLIDSGRTYYDIMEAAPNVKFAALYNKQHSISLDYWGSTLYNDTRWLNFPWEKQYEK
jgi:uncharacterized protein